MAKPVRLLIDELAACCGFFSNESKVNNCYNCNHPEPPEIEFDEELSRVVGKCLRCGCPIGVCVDGYDMMEVFDESVKQKILEHRKEVS